jgi:hypothetical protein
MQGVAGGAGRAMTSSGAASATGWGCEATRTRGDADLRAEVEGRPPSPPGLWRGRRLAGKVGIRHRAGTVKEAPLRWGEVAGRGSGASSRVASRPHRRRSGGGASRRHRCARWVGADAVEVSGEKQRKKQAARIWGFSKWSSGSPRGRWKEGEKITGIESMHACMR